MRTLVHLQKKEILCSSFWKKEERLSMFVFATKIKTQTQDYFLFFSFQRNE